MTTMQVKEQIDAMSDEDRFLAAAYLEHLSNEKDAAYRLNLSERMQRMDSGKKVSFEQLDRLHQALEREGM
ncbi:MAG: hypothetical protein B7Z37_21810 [Verrucomicrobia bacterium 12-59-8]|nr:MAG: hypothetical protein B7Z37_21810 [Verrucomicrobia bacterium 12-59-8]